MESEDDTWGDIDCNLEMFDWLSDKELIEETRIKILEHSRGTFRCAQNHEQGICFAPLVLEAVIAINKLYEETGRLHEKNRYILTYYLSMSELRLIYVF